MADSKFKPENYERMGSRGENFIYVKTHGTKIYFWLKFLFFYLYNLILKIYSAKTDAICRLCWKIYNKVVKSTKTH